MFFLKSFTVEFTQVVMIQSNNQSFHSQPSSFWYSGVYNLFHYETSNKINGCIEYFTVYEVACSRLLEPRRERRKRVYPLVFVPLASARGAWNRLYMRFIFCTFSQHHQTQRKLSKLSLSKIVL